MPRARPALPMRVAVMIALACTASCVPNNYRVDTRPLREHHAELVAGSARVDSSRGPIDVRGDDLVQLVGPDSVTRTVRLADVLADCPVHPPYEDVGCTHGITEVTVHRGRRLSSTTKGSLVLAGVAVGLGGLIYCTVARGSPGDWIAGGSLIAIGALTTLTIVTLATGGIGWN